jgi:glycogen operon protein
MILGGDELSRTQKGNNNAYCQDNEINWYEWSLDERRSAYLEFVKQVIAFRRKHPNFRRRRFLRGEVDVNGNKDALWWHPEGREMANGDWSGPLKAFGVLLRGDCINSRDMRGNELLDETFLVLFNASDSNATFSLPTEHADDPKGWELLGDLAPEEQAAWYDPEEEVIVDSTSLVVLRAVKQ